MQDNSQQEVYRPSPRAPVLEGSQRGHGKGRPEALREMGWGVLDAECLRMYVSVCMMLTSDVWACICQTVQTEAYLEQGAWVLSWVLKHHIWVLSLATRASPANGCDGEKCLPVSLGASPVA